jgi:hypothetical protein
VETVGGNKGIRATGAVKLEAGADASMVALNDLFMHSARNTAMSASGDITGSDPAMLFTIANGDVFFNIGSPLAFDAQVRQSGFRVDTVTGKVALTTKLGKVELNAGPNNTKIGGAPNVGPYSALLYEVFEGFMELFGNLIDTHVHTCPAAAAPTTTPLIPPYTGARYSLPPARSNFVKLGG